MDLLDPPYSTKTIPICWRIDNVGLIILFWLGNSYLGDRRSLGTGSCSEANNQRRLQMHVTSFTSIAPISYLWTVNNNCVGVPQKELD